MEPARRFWRVLKADEYKDRSTTLGVKFLNASNSWLKVALWGGFRALTASNLFGGGFSCRSPLRKWDDWGNTPGFRSIQANLDGFYLKMGPEQTSDPGPAIAQPSTTEKVSSCFFKVTCSSANDSGSRNPERGSPNHPESSPWEKSSRMIFMIFSDQKIAKSIPSPAKQVAAERSLASNKALSLKRFFCLCEIVVVWNILE